MLQLVGELTAFGMVLGFSPLHLGLLLLLLLGTEARSRGTWFVLGWVVTTATAIALMLSVGHRLVVTMEMGSAHRTGLDLVVAGALLGIGLKELLNPAEAELPPGWIARLERFSAMPVALLLLTSTALELASPDELLLLAKTAGLVLAASLKPVDEVSAVLLFSLISSLFLLVPLLGVLFVGESLATTGLKSARDLLYTKGQRLVGIASLAIAIYLGWQGIAGLQVGLTS